jgi:hypothetical protein
MSIEQIQFIIMSNFFRRPSEKMFAGEVSKKPQFEAFKKIWGIESRSREGMNEDLISNTQPKIWPSGACTIKPCHSCN